jgi:potassium voltage-gated channel Shaw-related subfamily C protein 1
MALLTTTISSVRTLPEIKESTLSNRDPNEAKRISDLNDSLDFVQLACSLWFLIEILIRFFSSPNHIKFIKSPFNIFDFVITIVSFSYYFVTDNQNSASVRSFSNVFKVLRVILLLRIFRNSSSLQLLGYVLRKSFKLIIVLLIYILVLAVIFSTFVYLVEQTDVENASITTIPDAMWWSVVTITTVGYGNYLDPIYVSILFQKILLVSGICMLFKGDYAPVTVYGKLFGK